MVHRAEGKGVAFLSLLATGASMSRPARIVLTAALLSVVLVQTAVAQSERLAAGAAALGQGKFDIAVKHLSAALNSSNLTPAQTAHALYQRGVAYRKLGQSSRAIADLSAALFLPSLSNGDKARTYINRALAYRAVGLGDSAKSDEAFARKIARREDVDRLMGDPGNEAATAAAAVVMPAAPRRVAAPSAPPPEAGEDEAPAGSARPPAPAPAQYSEAPPRSQRPTPGMAVYSPATYEDAPASAQSVEGEDAQMAEAEQSAAQPAAAEQTASVEPAVATPEGAAAPASPEPPKSISPPAFRETIPAEQNAGNAQRPAAPARTARAAPSPAWQTSVDQSGSSSEGAARAEPKKSGNRVTRFFGSVWDRATGRDSDEEQTDGAPLTATAAGHESGVVNAAARPQGTPSGGTYRLQLASSRSESEAREHWKRLAAANPELTSGREPQIDKTDLGSLGTVYRLHIGPFQDKAESLKVCNAFKRNGVDCFLVAR